MSQTNKNGLGLMSADAHRKVPRFSKHETKRAWPNPISHCKGVHKKCLQTLNPRLEVGCTWKAQDRDTAKQCTVFCRKLDWL